MTDLAGARAIAHSLDDGKAWRARGKVAVCVASTILNLIPVAGGAVARLVDEAGARFFDPSLEEKFSELCQLIASLEPTVAKIEDLEGALSAVQHTIAQNEAVGKRVEEFASVTYPLAKEFKATNVGSKQEFVDVTINNMRTMFMTAEGGYTSLHGVKTHGEDVHFQSTSGGKQRVVGSEFSGSGGSIGMDKIGLSGPVRTMTDNTAAVGLGHDGAIKFEPGGVLRFGRPRSK